MEFAIIFSSHHHWISKFRFSWAPCSICCIFCSTIFFCSLNLCLKVLFISGSIPATSVAEGSIAWGSTTWGDAAVPVLVTKLSRVWFPLTPPLPLPLIGGRPLSRLSSTSSRPHGSEDQEIFS